MKINLISTDTFDRLQSICKNNSALTFQNKGYEYINKSALTSEDAEALDQVSNILKNHIIGFSEFNNFRKDSDGDVELRFQYNYGAEDNSMSFIGVGYIKLKELLNGFNK